MSSSSPVFANRMLWLIFFVFAIQVIINPLRLLGIFNAALVVLLLIYVVGLIALFNVMRFGPSFFWIEWIMVLIVTIGAIFAFFVGNDTFKILTDILKPIFFICIVKLFRYYFVSLGDIEILSRGKVTFLTLAYVIGVAIVAFYYYWVGGVRASASAIPLALPFFYFFYRREFFWVLLVAVLFLVGGKFGPFMGTLIAVCLRYITSPRRLIISVVFVLPALLIVAFNANISESFITLPVIAKLHVGRFVESEMILNNIDKFNFGGRLSEAYSAIVAVREQFPSWEWGIPLGGGLGFTYEWRDFLGNVFMENNHGTHFTPIALYTIYGVPFTAFLLVYVFSVAWRAIRIISSSNNYVDLVWSSYLIASLINMLTAYSIFTNLLFAVSIAYVQSLKVRKSYDVTFQMRKTVSHQLV